MSIRERRNVAQRAAVVRRVVNALTENPNVTLTAAILRVWLNVPADAAQRILDRLISSGLLREIEHGTWVRKPL
jgi:hypothetical protein